MFHKIDMETWERKEYYHYYINFIKSKYNLLVGAMRGEPRGFRSGSDSAGAPPPFWFYTFPSRSGLVRRVWPRRDSWRCGTSLLIS